ncbi:MAG: hypothetical protein AAGJ97_13600, partial [Planctomycetota bacterium]
GLSAVGCQLPKAGSSCDCVDVPADFAGETPASAPAAPELPLSSPAVDGLEPPPSDAVPGLDLPPATL